MNHLQEPTNQYNYGWSSAQPSQQLQSRIFSDLQKNDSTNSLLTEDSVHSIGVPGTTSPLDNSDDLPVNTSELFARTLQFQQQQYLQNPQLNVKTAESLDPRFFRTDEGATETGTNSKPPFSYATLISNAINSSPDKMMTLNDIYNWIIEKYPFYKSAPAGWKNSIRHNLSLSKIFVRVPRPPNQPGKGAFWTIDTSAAEERDTKKTRGNRAQSDPQPYRKEPKIKVEGPRSAPLLSTNYTKPLPSSYHPYNRPAQAYSTQQERPIGQQLFQTNYDQKQELERPRFTFDSPSYHYNYESIQEEAPMPAHARTSYDPSQFFVTAGFNNFPASTASGNYALDLASQVNDPLREPRVTASQDQSLRADNMPADVLNRYRSVSLGQQSDINGFFY